MECRSRVLVTAHLKRLFDPEIQHQSIAKSDQNRLVTRTTIQITLLVGGFNPSQIY